MAKTYTGTYKKAANYDIRKPVPFDARIVVNKVSDLTLLDTWDTGDGIAWLYSGLVVAVIETKALYMLTGYDYSKTPTAYQVASNWKRLDADAATVVEVIDNLESESATAALSAAQGKALNDMLTTVETTANDAISVANEAKSTADAASLKVTDILGDSTETLDDKIKAAKDAIKESLGTVYSYKGSCTYAGLPADAVAGDVWNVTDAHGDVPAGTNYAKTADGWDALGGTVDLSSYATSADVTSDIATAKADAISKVKADLEPTIADAKKAGTDAQATANEAKTAAEANTTEIADVKSKLDALDTSVGTRLSTLDTSVGTQANELKTLKATVDTLTGGDTETGGIFEAIAAVKAEVLGEVQKDYATKAELKVVSDKVDANTSDLTTVKSDLEALTTNVTTNETDIATLKTSVKSNTDDLVILKGNESTEGSIDYKIKNAVDKVKLTWKSYPPTNA